ncbi:hypothetical protein [uncultured Kordia sp.]|uniref:hypothetical protein n=1 Tax=uncultured Kordia sp. TaxID=507699 RepID=UPI00262F48D5|nr:hypothetical protein [uncultured Kordia sp.]
MKKRIFALVLTCALLTISCSSDDLTIEEMTLSKAEQYAIVKLVSTNLSVGKSAPVVISSVKLKKIEDSYYLSSYHGDKITTTLLKIEGDTTLKYAGISCTSKACSTTDGCVPDKDGKKCAKCPWAGDCTKTVTSDIIQE